MCRLRPVQTWSAHPPHHLDPQLFCPVPFLRSMFFLFFLLFLIADPLRGRAAQCPNPCHDAQRKYLLRTATVLRGCGSFSRLFILSATTSLSSGSQGVAQSRASAPWMEQDLPGTALTARHLAQGMPSPPWHLSWEGDRPVWSTRARHSPGSEGRAVHREKALSGGTAFQGQQPVKGLGSKYCHLCGPAPLWSW